MQNSEQSVFEAVIEPVLVSRAVKFEVDQEKHNSPTLPNILHHYSKLIITTYKTTPVPQNQQASELRYFPRFSSSGWALVVVQRLSRYGRTRFESPQARG